MAVVATVGQKTVGTSAVQFTNDAAAANTKLVQGIKLAYSGTAKIYYGFSSGVTTSNGFLINNNDQIVPGECQYVGDPWFISDTAGQALSYSILGQVVTIS